MVFTLSLTTPMAAGLENENAVIDFSLLFGATDLVQEATINTAKTPKKTLMLQNFFMKHSF
jgi:hypothetical protein